MLRTRDALFLLPLLIQNQGVEDKQNHYVAEQVHLSTEKKLNEKTVPIEKEEKKNTGGQKIPFSTKTKSQRHGRHGRKNAGRKKYFVSGTCLLTDLDRSIAMPATTHPLTARRPSNYTI